MHPRGTLLWKTGLNDAAYNRSEGGGAKHDKIDKSLKRQLAEVGYQPKAISHLPGDPFGKRKRYPGSTWRAPKPSAIIYSGPLLEALVNRVRRTCRVR